MRPTNAHRERPLGDQSDHVRLLGQRAQVIPEQILLSALELGQFRVWCDVLPYQGAVVGQRLVSNARLEYRHLLQIWATPR